MAKPDKKRAGASTRNCTYCAAQLPANSGNRALCDVCKKLPRARRKIDVWGERTYVREVGR